VAASVARLASLLRQLPIKHGEWDRPRRGPLSSIRIDTVISCRADYQLRSERLMRTLT
jgi:hypothetical protein